MTNYTANSIVAQVRNEAQDVRAETNLPFAAYEQSIAPNTVLIIELDTELNITYGVEVNGVIVAITHNDFRAPFMVAAILQ